MIGPCSCCLATRNAEEQAAKRPLVHLHDGLTGEVGTTVEQQDVDVGAKLNDRLDRVVGHVSAAVQMQLLRRQRLLERGLNSDCVLDLRI